MPPRWAALACVLLPAATAAAAAAGPGPDPAVQRRVDALMAKLSPDDELRLLSGVDDFYTQAAPSAGIPRFRMSDGPVGTRDGHPSTAYPAGAMLAATWDPDLAQREGEALGRDDRARGVHVLLGPGVNIYRVPQNGRNFEYFGEDPLLAARTAAGYCRGVQSQGVAACVKHFACNNEEVDRDTVDVAVSDRALHEIYLPAFEGAIKGGGCRTIMASYNLVNGHHATANHHLLSDVLRDQWGFDGVAMSDWWATHGVADCLDAGLDLEMPGGQWFTPAKLAGPLRDGRVTKAALDRKVRRLLTVAVQMGWLDRDQRLAALPTDNPENDAVALDVARAGTVLLKNAGGALPLDRARVRRVAVLGPDADRYVRGGGSSEVRPARPVSLLAGLQGVAPGVQFDRVPFHGLGGGDMHRLARASAFDGPLTATFYAGKELAGEPLLTRQDPAIDFDWKGPPGPGVPHDNFSVRWTGRLTPTVTGPYRLSLRSDDGSRVKLDGQTVLDAWGDHQASTYSADVRLTAGRPVAITVEYYQGGGDAVAQFGYGPIPRPLTDAERQAVASADAAVVLVHTQESEGSDRPYDLPTEQVELVQQVAAANPHTVVVLEAGGNVGMASWVDRVPALVDGWFPGQAGGRAIAEVLFGDVNPSGHLPDTFERQWADSFAHDHYPGVKGHVEYAEGIYVGYRYYDAHGVVPRFPFGHGLSYTTFDMRNPKVVPAGTGDDRTFAVTVDVTNTGKVAGAAVAQLYVRPPAGEPVDRPPQELKGFARVVLQPGETRPVTMTLDRRSFAHWDEATNGWAVVPGTYGIAVGRSSRDVCCTTTADWR